MVAKHPKQHGRNIETMILLRSLVFNIVFYINLIVLMIVLLPAILFPQPLFMRIAPVLWARTSLFWLRLIVGTRVEFRGTEHIPDSGCLVVAKHQSLLETFALVTQIHNPAIIFKRELMWIPFFGWYLWAARMVPINRGARVAAIAAMNQRSREEVALGRHILIFAEGTRRPPAALPAYKQGFSHLYAELGAPILPVAVNCGYYWPRRRFIRQPGNAVIEFLPLVPPGLTRDQAFTEVQTIIETACARLNDEARAELGAAALVAEAVPAKASSISS
jgi:1-acyl-sn-glycerol-3-phosphate acyltransferase